MSNLSDLLPAGAGAKVITATADGNLATGQTVILQSDGTVKEVSATTVTENIGSAVEYGASGQTEYPAVVFDPDTNKVIIAYRDNGNSNYGTARVGTVSGNSISFGTAVVFQSSGSNYIDASYDTGQDKVLIVYQSYDEGNGPVKAIVGTVSGTNISFGSSGNVDSNQSLRSRVAYSPDDGKHMVIYSDSSQSGRGAARLVTVSGSSFTASVDSIFESNSVNDPMDVVYDTTNDKFVVAYNDNNTRGRTKVGAVSGSSITFTGGSAWDTAGTYEAEDIRLAFDSNLSKVIIAYQDKDNDRRGRAVVGEVSGTDFNTGTKVQFEGGITDVHSIVFDSTANKVVIQYRDQNNSDYGQYVVGTPTSGNSISFATPVAITNYNNNFGGAAFDSNAGRTVFALSDSDNSRGKAYVLQLDTTLTNSNNFVGITNQAINDTASGEVVVEGGVITNGSLLPSVASISFGTDVAFESSGEAIYECICYDTANDKIVIAYMHNSGSQHGKAIVGTVSGTSISFGSAVTFNAATTNRMSIAFDASASKVVIAYQDDGNSSYGTAIVGTVSGTSISFGTAVVFESASTGRPTISYDANASKHLIAYKDAGNSNYLTGIVGTVSGTSISFGTAAILRYNSPAAIAIAYDSTAQKHALIMQNSSASNRGDAQVITISGTTPSSGTAVSGWATDISRPSATYDSSSGKVVVAYQDNDNSNYATAVVSTISGTDISFGSTVVVNAASSLAIEAVYDATSNATFVLYKDGGNSSYGTAKGGIVSGTDISFGSATVFLTANPGGDIAATIDTDNNKLVAAYIDYGNSQNGTAVVGTPSSGVPNFTIGSTYYVQNDGTLSTTSSSVTAGKAIANTTLLLKG